MALHVAIDGPAGSGKTTVARGLARRLGTPYLDTGAMYRALAWAALRAGCDPRNESGLVQLLMRQPIRLERDPQDAARFRITIGGCDPGAALYANDVSAIVSLVAAHGAIRRAMVEGQRAIARDRPVVMAGRDIGTVVLPDAGLKIFLTASLEERVARRASELGERGIAVERETLRADIERRDRLDETRDVAPLRAAPDALHVDSTGETATAVVDRLAALVTERTHPYNADGCAGGDL